MVIACGVLEAGCAGGENAAAPATTTTIGTSTTSVPAPCATSMPFVVTTENLTQSPSDLCAAFNRSVASLPNPSALGAGSFELRVTLAKLVESPRIACYLGISVSSTSERFAAAHGGAKIGSTASDCIDVVLDDLMTRRVGPLMQQHVAQLAGPPTAGSAASPTSPSPVPPQPAP